MFSAEASTSRQRRAPKNVPVPGTRKLGGSRHRRRNDSSARTAGQASVAPGVFVFAIRGLTPERLHDSAAARLRHALARRDQGLRQCGY